MGVGEGEAGTECFDDVGDVVVKKDARENVFGSADGHGSFEKAFVTL